MHAALHARSCCSCDPYHVLICKVGNTSLKLATCQDVVFSENATSSIKGRLQSNMTSDDMVAADPIREMLAPIVDLLEREKLGTSHDKGDSIDMKVADAAMQQEDRLRLHALGYAYMYA